LSLFFTLSIFTSLSLLGATSPTDPSAAGGVADPPPWPASGWYVCVCCVCVSFWGLIVLFCLFFRCRELSITTRTPLSFTASHRSAHRAYFPMMSIIVVRLISCNRLRTQPYPLDCFFATIPARPPFCNCPHPDLQRHRPTWCYLLVHDCRICSPKVDWRQLNLDETDNVLQIRPPGGGRCVTTADVYAGRHLHHGR